MPDSVNEGTSDHVVIHPLNSDDIAFTAALRAAVSSTKGVSRGIEGRGQYDALLEGVLPRDDVTYEKAYLGAIPGIWVRPENGRVDGAILHLHGGWFNLGSAWAYRHLVGQIAARTGAPAFVPNYRLAPEHPFPAAPADALECLKELGENGVNRIALSGDSAGGNLALALAARVTSDVGYANTSLVGTAVLSPVTDLTLSGATYETRADADPFFTRSQIADLVHSYLGNADPGQPLASPLFGRFSGMPPVRIHVGDDELLLDDSLRYVDRAVSEGVDARVDVWMGMPHGFPANVGKLKAAATALDAVGAFLTQRLHAHAIS